MVWIKHGRNHLKITDSNEAQFPGLRDLTQEAARRVKTPYLTRRRCCSPPRERLDLTKYAANAFLATKITFINEMADLCEKVGADVQDVARGIGLDGRIGGKFLHAGPGFGGSCFPKDTLALLKTVAGRGAPTRIVEAVVRSTTRARCDGRQDRDAFGGVKGKTIAVLGLTFKPNTDDMRDAPSLVIVPQLQARARASAPTTGRPRKRAS